MPGDPRLHHAAGLHGDRHRHGQRQPRRDRRQQRRLALHAVTEARDERVADRIDAVIEARAKRLHPHVSDESPDRRAVVVHGTET